MLVFFLILYRSISTITIAMVYSSLLVSIILVVKIVLRVLFVSSSLLSSLIDLESSIIDLKS